MIIIIHNHKIKQMENNTPLSLGAQIKQMRAYKRVSRDRLAEICGVSSRTILEIEHGYDSWSKEKLNRIAAALGCSIEIRLHSLPVSVMERIQEAVANGDIHEYGKEDTV